VRRSLPNLVRVFGIVWCGLTLLCHSASAAPEPEKQDVTLNEVIASPSHYRDADMSLEGLVGDARLARGPEGRTCSFALVSPNSNMGLAILGADAPETGLYVRVEGPLRLDPRLNTPYIESPRVTVLHELPLWLRPADHQSLAALGAILCAMAACLLLVSIRRPSSVAPSPERFSALISTAVLPPRAETPAPATVAEYVAPAPDTSIGDEGCEPGASDDDTPLTAETVSLDPEALVAGSEGPAPSGPAEGVPARETSTGDESPEPTASSDAAPTAEAESEEPPTVPDGDASVPIVGMVLEVVAGPDRGRVFEARGPRVTIGRSEDRDVPLTDELVARHQATLTRSNGVVLLSSEVPGAVVCLNSRPVRQAEIAAHDVIRMGCSELRLIASPSAAELGPSVPAQ
jgi:pSer/pThr/pTyr-binding forkhead associated (FHA) protein